MNLQILFPNASARLLAFPPFNDFNGPAQFGCTVSNEDGLQELCPAGGHADTWHGMLWRMLKCAVSADSRPIEAPHRTRFKTLSTAVDSCNGRLMIIMFCIFRYLFLKHSTLAKNSRQGWDLFIGMIPILQVIFRYWFYSSCFFRTFGAAKMTWSEKLPKDRIWLRRPDRETVQTHLWNASSRCAEMLSALAVPIRYYQILSETLKFEIIVDEMSWNVNIKVRNAADNAILSMQYLRHDSHICWLWKTSDCRNRVNNSIKISK